MKITRRQVLCSLATLAAAHRLGGARANTKRPRQFRLAICNETFTKMSFAEMCRAAKKTGYTGVEVAPFTLADDPAALPVTRRAELNRVMRSEGVKYIGLHAVLTAPKWLHVTTPDRPTRDRSWDYVRRLIDLSADLGGGDSIMVFGSGKQRSTAGGSTVADAVARFAEGLAGVAPAARARGVTILIEPLAPHLSDVVNTLDAAAAIAEQINSPAVRIMFDTHNAAAEQLPHGEAIKKHRRLIRHVHLNEMDGKHPGTGGYDFAAVLRALKDVSYDGWVSLEVFDFSPGGEKIALDSADYIRALEARLH